MITPENARPRPPLGLGSALIGKEEEELVLDVLRRKEPFRYYGHGGEAPPMAATLEKEFAALVGTEYALGVTSCTGALEVALGALGVGPGDEVIIPAWSWVSCFTSVVRVGALPVLAEIDETLCLAPGEITRLKTASTKAVIVVHYQGVAADMDPIITEARAANIKVLEDCAESPGAMYHGRRVGSMGDIGVFSFQFHKTITAGEGGMVVTDCALLYERCVRMHDLGQLRPYHRQQVEPEVIPFAGSQFRMSELTAAMALAQLRKLDGIRHHCRSLQQRVMDQIRDLPGLEFRRIPDPTGDSGFEIYLFLRDAEQAKAFRQKLQELNVNCLPGTHTGCHVHQQYCIHAQAHTPSASPFAKFETWPAKGYRAEDFARTLAFLARFISLPIGALFTPDDADYIAACVRQSYCEVI